MKTESTTIDDIFIKLEYLNPSGSVKDRMANYIIKKAEKSGKLKKGYTIIEATSGNTGIAFSRIAALKGYKMIAIIPEGLSKERTQIMEAYGAKIIKTKKGDFFGAIKKTKELGKKSKTFLPSQFENPLNPEEHEKFLGKEISDSVNHLDAFVAGVGTGGTLIGVSKALKRKFPNVKIFALEPTECRLLAKNKIAKIFGNKKIAEIKSHKIEGIADNIIPKIIQDNKELIDGIIDVSSKDAIKSARELSRIGHFVGPSSGANFLGAKLLKEKYGFKKVATLFCDRGDKYLSEGNYD